MMGTINNPPPIPARVAMNPPANPMTANSDVRKARSESNKGFPSCRLKNVLYTNCPMEYTNRRVIKIRKLGPVK